MLRLSVVDELKVDGQTREVLVAVDFAPGKATTLPTMADLRVSVSGPVEVTSVALGAEVVAAKKRLYVDASTGKPFRTLPDGTVQLLLFSTGNTTPLPDGRLLVLRARFRSDVASGLALGSAPAVFRLVEREETFAPAEADALLWGGGLAEPVVLWPEVGHD